MTVRWGREVESGTRAQANFAERRHRRRRPLRGRRGAAESRLSLGTPSPARTTWPGTSATTTAIEAASTRYLVVEVDAETSGGVRADSGPGPRSFGENKFQVARRRVLLLMIEGFRRESHQWDRRVADADPVRR